MTTAAWLDQVGYWAGSPAGAERVTERFLGVAFQPGPNQHEEWSDLETPYRYWAVVARRLEETER